MSWLMWQMGSAPYLGGGLGISTPTQRRRFNTPSIASPWKRNASWDVLDRRLAESKYIAGDNYTIADMAISPWYGNLAKGLTYGAGEFLSVHEYTNVRRWADMLLERPAVQRGTQWSTARLANRRSNCMNVTTPAISRRRRKIK